MLWSIWSRFLSLQYCLVVACRIYLSYIEKVAMPLMCPLPTYFSVELVCIASRRVVVYFLVVGAHYRGLVVSRTSLLRAYLWLMGAVFESWGISSFFNGGGGPFITDGF